VTWPIEGEPGEYIREMYQVAQLAPKREGKQLTLQLTDTPQGAKMLTAGSRQSELYGRMYDKWAESKMPEYKSCVRWEVECKADTARDVNAHLRENRNEAHAVRAMVMDYWSRRGMTPFWETYEAMEMVPPVKRSKTDETKIAWLAAQVHPTLQVLKEHGRLAHAIRALFGQGLTEAQVQGIIDLLSDDVGS
jgi:DNA relaxase NicK